MLKIWGRQNSSNVKKVLWAAQELNLDYQRFDLGGHFGGLDNPDFLKCNPNGLVPLLEDGETVLWESNTIVRYLAAVYGKGSLWIDDPAQRAQAEKWMDWASTTLVNDFRDVIQHLVRLPDEKRDPAIARRAAEGLARSMTIAENALSEAPWFSGQSLGIGDIPLGVIAYGWFGLSIERPSLPRLEDWYHRLQARPTYRSTIMIPIT
ncbi:glutathione S-transferase [Brucella sp. BE17]|uniref:glutathione S-transferase family protein n=1 Tax=Brucella sp. BE17 TaxID=3142977 RepID=UPI0031BADDB2